MKSQLEISKIIGLVQGPGEFIEWVGLDLSKLFGNTKFVSFFNS